MIKILPETTKKPLTLMGARAGICWGADITDDAKNQRRGRECLKSGHGRVAEFVNVEMVIDGYSARVIREWYTHLGGSPTRLQGSTRYIDYSNFEYVEPMQIQADDKAHAIYQKAMVQIANACSDLTDLGIAREDAAMLLPLGMSTVIVDKRNLRNLIDMSHQRLCTRAYWEYRQLMGEIAKKLSEYSPEWAEIVRDYFRPKCEILGYCPEAKCCGRVNRES